MFIRVANYLIPAYRLTARIVFYPLGKRPRRTGMVIILLFLTAGICFLYQTSHSRRQQLFQKTAAAKYIQTVKKGDLYFGGYSYFSGDSLRQGWGWLRIASVSAGSIYVQLSRDQYARPGIDPALYRYDHFEERLFAVKLEVTKRINTFRDPDRGFHFQITKKR